MNDAGLINGMVSSQKPKKAKKMKNFKIILNRIIDILRLNGGKISKKELSKKLEDIDLGSRDFYDQLLQYKKIAYDPVRELFELKSEYNLKNIEELKNKIRTSEHGIVEDEELKDSYPGIKDDIERLKSEKFVRVILNNEKKCNVLFYRDMADEFEKILINPEYDQSIQEIRKVWNLELNHSSFEQYATILKKRPRPDEELQNIPNSSGKKKKGK